jgi:hypothetical protein
VTTLLGKDKRLIREKELYYNDKYKQGYMVGTKTSVEPRWIHHQGMSSYIGLVHEENAAHECQVSD